MNKVGESMRHFIILLLLIIILGCNKNNIDSQKNNGVNFDSLKALSYGADDYGMKTYVFAFLKKGPNRDMDSVMAAELQKAHLKNIGRLADEGKLVLAGPFYGDGDTRGIYIFDVPTIEEAKKLTETDPAIKEGRLKMELIQWYGTAALLEVNEISKTLAKKSFALD